MFTSTGKLIYNPIQGKKEPEPYWLLLMVDDEITRLYRFVIKQRFFKDICLPSWGSHISVNTGIVPPVDKQHFWKKYDNKKVKFVYDNYIRTVNDDTQGGQFYFINAYSDELDSILWELGTLEYGFKKRYHITIGRTYNNFNRIILE